MGSRFAAAGTAVILLILTACNPLIATAESNDGETIEVESNGDRGWVRLSCDSPNSGACNTASIRVIDSDGEVHELEANASNSAETWLDGGEGTVSIHLPPQYNSSHWNVHYVIPTSEGHEVGDHPESTNRCTHGCKELRFSKITFVLLDHTQGMSVRTLRTEKWVS